MSGETRSKLVMEGICEEQGCGKPIDGPYSWRCREHKIEHAKRQKALRDERLLKGLCPYCGREQLLDGIKQCLHCKIEDNVTLLQLFAEDADPEQWAQSFEELANSHPRIEKKLRKP